MIGLKKIFLVILVLPICGIILNACSANTSEAISEPVAVTLDSSNFSDYIVLDVKLEDIEQEERRGLLGLEYRGSAQLTAEASLRKDVQVDNVVIEGRIVTWGMLWNYNIYNFTLELNKDGEAEYSNTIYSGEYNLFSPENPTLMNADEMQRSLELNENEFITEVDDGAVAIQVSGTIYE